MRHWMSWVWFAIPVVALAAAPAGTRSPAEELDAELNAQVKIPGPELVVITDGPDPDRYALAEGSVTLDGKPLPGPVQPGWGKRFWEGPIAAGNHVITAEFAYRAARTGPYPWSDTYGYRVPGKVEFQAQRGLRLVVHLRVEVREDQEDPRNRLAFRAALEPEMTAKVDDAPLPPPPPRKVTPEDLVQPQLTAPLASVPANPPPAPTKTKKKTPKKKKTSVAAAAVPSLDAATARLQQAITQPSTPPSESSKGKSKKPDAGTP